MKITQREVTVRDLVRGFKDTQENGVFAYGGNLNVRPPYQREFVYKPNQMKAVIDSVINGLPLNLFYWAKTDGTNFEIIDGQQRTISLCQYVGDIDKAKTGSDGRLLTNGEFSIEIDGSSRYFSSLTKDQQDQILNYQLLVFVCEGTDSEKLKWFDIINIAGTVLTKQELRNAVYTGPWLLDAKKWFSRTGCPAASLGENYVKGSPLRQDLLELALNWVCLRDGLKTPEEYMSLHQHDGNANDIWGYYSQVVNWAKGTFTVSRRELKSVNWAKLYEAHHKDTSLNAQDLETRVAKLMADVDVTKKSGVYEYVLSGKESALSIRAFTPAQKRVAYEAQNGICPDCNGSFTFDEMHGDHKLPWSKGGRTIQENCAMLCRDCNLAKSDK